MTQLKERDVEKWLQSVEAPAPPADLAARIKAEIPENLAVPASLGSAPDAPAGDGEGVVVTGRFPSRRRAFLLAASFLTVVGGGFLAYRLFLERPEPPWTSRPLAVEIAPPSSSEPTGAEDKTAGDRSGGARGEAAPATPVEERVEAAEADERDARQAAVEQAHPGKGPEDHRPAGPPAGGDDLAESRTAASRDSRALSSPAEPKVVAPPRTAPAPPPAAARTAPPALKIPPPAAPPPPPPQIRQSLRKRQDQIRRKLEPQERGQVEASGYLGVAETESLSKKAAPSTGGTTEPNEEPYGDVFFEGYGTNPFIDTEDDRLSTFGLDVDTASYAVVRRFLRDGNMPPRDAVRVEELVNYFDYGDAPPEDADFAIHAEGAPSIFGEGERYYQLRFNLRGREVEDRDRPPAVLTFVVDVSGSMDQENRLGLVKQALTLLLDQLRADDRVALVVYGSRGRVILEPTGDRERVRRAIDELRSEGSTNAEEGLRLGYQIAAGAHRRGTINRVILCSDGVANVGLTSAESILDEIRRYAHGGVELTTVGFGMGNYNDVLMEQLADIGNGRYAYVDTLDEARRIFVENLTGTLQTIAAEARVQVEFNPAIVSRYRLIGYENRDIEDHRFRDDTVDAGEIGAGHTVTALYEVKLARQPRRRDTLAVLHLRYASIARGEMVEQSRTVTGADFARTWYDASPAFRLTSLVAEFGEIVGQRYWARTGDLDQVFRLAQRTSADFAGDVDVAELVSLVGRAARNPSE